MKVSSCAFCVHGRMTPRPVQHGVGVEMDAVLPVSEPPSVLHVRADCGGRLFTAKLGVVVHYLSHQLLDHLLADKTLLDGCKGLRTRSL